MNRSTPSKNIFRVFSVLTILFCGSIWIVFAGAARPSSDGANSYLPLLLDAWPTPQPGRLLLSEIIYDPDGPEPGGEWIEIYNAGGSPVDLSGYKIGDEETQGEQEGMYSFPSGASIAPDQALVVAYDASIFAYLYGSVPDYELRGPDPDVPDMLRYTPWAGGGIELVNTGDEVLLIDGSDRPVDALSWGSSPYAFDPPVAKISGGHSLERYPADIDTDSAADWRDQDLPSPGRVELAAPSPSPSPTGDGPIATITPEITGTVGATLTPSATPTPTGTATRVSPFALVFNEIHADPHALFGDANGDGAIQITADEFIEIVNRTDAILDLSGWEIHDLVRMRHRFPPGSLVTGGCAVVIFGGGQPAKDFGGSRVQTASSGTLALNNEGDTLTLYDLNGDEVISYTYGTEAGEDQSLTRSPDISGRDPLIKHSTAPGSGGALYSPGTKLDGGQFSGCG